MNEVFTNEAVERPLGRHARRAFGGGGDHGDDD